MANASTSAGTLGDHFKVSRGTVTGDRSFFVMSKARARERGLIEWALPVITSSREFGTNEVLRDGPGRDVVIVVPANIDRTKHPAVDAWLREGDEVGKNAKRPAWWAFSIKRPPAAATYKGERGPRLVANPDRMVLLNIAYALEPRTRMDDDEIEAFVRQFNAKERRSNRRQALSMATEEVAASLI